MSRLPQVSKLILLLSLACAGHPSPTIAQDEKPWQANPEIVKKMSGNSRQFNYVESQVPEYTLPDPLLLASGEVVASAEDWESRRRPELLEIFRSQVYGRRPDTAYEIKFEQLEKVESLFAGQATGLSLKAIVTIADRKFEFPFVVFLPNQRERKSPAIILINNRYFTTLEEATEKVDEFWPVKKMIERGYATASFLTGDVDPDRADGYAAGIRSFFAAGAPAEDDAWRSLSAWGWAASRVLDYMETIDSIDASRVAVVGHSRGGKTALWAASEDTRFAIGYSNNSGCGGAALSRRSYGETVERITTAFPHWFTPNFNAYAGKEDELPIDQHELIALLAPRGVYVTSADEDLWADPQGEYASLVAASPVFKRLGVKSIEQPEMPPLNQQRIVGQTGYHIRSGGHGLEALDWDLFLDFADRSFSP